MHVALCEPSACEPTRRALDAEGLLDVSTRAFKHDGCIALPLSDAAQSLLEPSCGERGEPEGDDEDGDEQPMLLHWSGGVLRAARLSGYAAVREGRGPRAALRAACALALAQSPAEVAAAILEPDALPRRWEKLGDVVLLSPTGFFEEGTEAAAALGQLPAEHRAALWAALAASIGAERLGVQSRIEGSLHRKSTARLLWPKEGADGWTLHRENGIVYGFDVTKNMFSSGNGTEKARVAKFACAGETVVDLYAGIGYFSLNYLVHSKAAHLHACEWDDDALAALRHNLEANGVAGRCTVYTGDNAASLPAFRAQAHRVNLGLIPSSEAGWPVAVGALRPEGGHLHVHANVSSSRAEEAAWADNLLGRIRELARGLGREWNVSLGHLERVKWYAPRVRHVVADVSCVQR